MKQLIFALVMISASQLGFSADFNTGPLIKSFGKHAPVTQTQALKPNQKFKVVFDVSKQTEEGKVNRSFESLARFLNMHVANGIPAENIELALVVHGKAGFDLLKHADYKSKYQSSNPNIALLDELVKNNVRIFICGQSAAYLGIKNEQLHAGVNVALSAMTANALLQQEGYTLNPF